MKLLLNVGTLIDATGAPPLYNMSVLIDGDRIVQIGAYGSIMAGDEQVINAPNSTLLPGLFDLHSHMSLFLPPSNEPVDQSLQREDLIAARVFKAARAGQVWLQCGVTTIRHAGAGNNFAVAMKEAIADGLTTGPRVFASGALIAQTGGVRRGNEYIAVEVTGVDEARRVAREQLKAGVDVLKIYAASSLGGGGGRLIAESGWPQLSFEEIRAIAEEAHKPARLVSAHTASTISIKNAIMAGVDWLDHATFLDNETIELLLKTNTPIVPTLAAMWSFERFGTFGKHIADKAREVAVIAKERLHQAYLAGVRIATGTDTGDPRACVAKECELLTEIGMSPMEAIVAATRTPAEILQVNNKLGTIEQGKIADLLIVDGNPLVDIRNLAYDKVQYVIQGGKVLPLPLVDLSPWGL